MTDDTASGAKSATENVGKLEKSMRKMQETANGLKKISKLEITANLMDKASKGIGNIIGLGKQIAGKIWEVAVKAKDTASKIIKGAWDLGKNIAGKTWNVTLKAVDLITAPVRGIIDLLKNPVLQMASIAGISLGAADTVNTYSDFEQEIANLKGITGASVDEMQKMEDGIRKVALNSNKSVIEIAANAKMVAEAGGDIDLMLSQLTHGVNLATATQTDMATTLDFLGSAMKTFGVEAEDTQSVADSLAYTTRLANVELSQLAESYVNVGGSAANAGLGINDINSALVTLSNAGLKGGAAGTSLNTMFDNLTSPTDKAAKTIKSLGLSLYDASGQSRNMFDIMSDLEKRLSGMSDQKRNSYLSDIFDDVALKGWNYLAADGMDNIRALSAELSYLSGDFGGIGTAAGMAETQLDTVGGAFSLLRRAADDFKISIGEKAAPYIRQFTSWLTGKIPKATEYAIKAFDWIEKKVKGAQKAIKSLTSNSKWQNADLFGKIGVAWDELIKKPFDKWWNGSGKSWLLQKGGEIGGWLENALISGVKGLFGEKAAQSVSGALDWIKTKAGEAAGAIDSLTNSPEWQNADSIWDKIKLSWSKLVAEPFGEWWDGGGRDFIIGKAGDIGKGIGSGLSTGLLAILGFNESDAFTDATSIGGSFTGGFMEGFDTEKVGEALQTAFDNALKWVIKQIPTVLKTIISQIPTVLKTAFSNPVTAVIATTFIADVILKGIKKAIETKDILNGIFGKKENGESNSLQDILENSGVTSTQTMNVTAGTVIVNGATQQGTPNINNTPGVPSIPNGSGKTPSLSGNSGSTPALPSGGNNGTQKIIETKFTNPSTSGGGSSVTGGGTLTASTLLKSIPLAAEVLANLFIPSSSAQWKMESQDKRVQSINDLYVQQSNGTSSNISTAEQKKLEKMDFDELYSGIMGANIEGNLDKYMKQAFKGIGDDVQTAVLDYIFGGEKGFSFGDIENTGLLMSNKQKKINSALSGLLADVEYLNEQFGNVPDEVNTKYTVEFGLKNPDLLNRLENFMTSENSFYKSDWNVSKQNSATSPFSNDTAKNIFANKYADGGILNRPHMGLVAEAGPEAVIPLSGNKRNRGLSLWEKAGEMLGVKPYAEGAIINATPAAASGNTGDSGYGYVSVPVTIDNINFNVDIDGGNDMSAEDIVRIVKANIANLTDEIAYTLATSVQQAFANMSLATED